MLKWLFPLLAFLPGCATIFFQEDGFSDKMHQHCRSKDSCEQLRLEAQDRARRCRSNTVGYVRCQDAQADIAWLKDKAHYYEGKEAEAAHKAREVREQEEAELRQRQARADAEEKERQQEEEAKRARIKAAAQELEDWGGANVETCKQASAIEACDALQAYVLKYKLGSPHIATAHVALAEALPKIEVLRDEEKWKASRANDCKRPKTSNGCQDVTAYVQSFPEGKHSEEARKLLKGSEKTIGALAAAEERKRIWEEKMAEQKRLQEERLEAARRAAKEAEEESALEEAGVEVSHGGRAHGGGGRSKGGGSTHVSGYTRKDGTHVRSHTRGRGRRK